MMNEQQQNGEIEIHCEEMKPRKLNWTKVLFDYHIYLDAQAFQKWDGDLHMDGQQILEKDIPRTRCEDPQMKKQSFRQVLRRITTFYCKQNGVTYQQGLLEVVYPFALLRRKQFKTKKCYAYFNAFMRKHFPKVLVQRVVEGKKQLPHAMLAITLTDCLLRFHYPALSNCLKQHQIPISMVATQQLLTVFAKNLPIRFVYQIYDYFIQKNDSNYIFYMEVAMIGLEQQTLMEAAANEQIHKYVQNIKKITLMQDLKKWFVLSQIIAKNTPQSFAAIANEFCFNNRNLLSTQDVQKMLKSQQLVAGGYLPISIEEINKNTNKYVFLLLQTQIVSHQYHYQAVRVNPTKPISEYQLDQNKIYVLAVQQKYLEEENKILLDFASKFPHIRFLMLREYLVDDKNQKCTIF